MDTHWRHTFRTHIEDIHLGHTLKTYIEDKRRDTLRTHFEDTHWRHTLKKHIEEDKRRHTLRTNIEDTHRGHTLRTPTWGHILEDLHLRTHTWGHALEDTHLRAHIYDIETCIFNWESIFSMVDHINYVYYLFFRLEWGGTETNGEVADQIAFKSGQFYSPTSPLPSPPKKISLNPSIN